MRQGQQNRRGRGRNNNQNHNQHRKGHHQNPLTRSYKSNGPDVKIRGNPAHIAEKYFSLARDAQSSGDPVLAENYLQHAEHYNRIILAYREQQIQQHGEVGNGASLPRRHPMPGEAFDEELGDEAGMDDGQLDTTAMQVRGQEPQPRFFDPNQSGEPRHDDRPHRQQGEGIVAKVRVANVKVANVKVANVKVGTAKVAIVKGATRASSRTASAWGASIANTVKIVTGRTVDQIVVQIVGPTVDQSACRIATVASASIEIGTTVDRAATGRNASSERRWRPAQVLVRAQVRRSIRQFRRPSSPAVASVRSGSIGQTVPSVLSALWRPSHSSTNPSFCGDPCGGRAARRQWLLPTM